MNRKNLLIFVLFAVVALFLGSCKKEKEVAPTELNAEKVLNDLRAENYSSLQQIVLDLYAEKTGGGFKSISDAKVGFSVPANSYIYIPEPSEIRYKLVFIWSLIDYNNLLDKGVIVVSYNDQSQIQGDPEFFMGWDNEYCVEVNFKSNLNPLMIRITFDYPIQLGSLGFEEYAYTWEDSYSVRLPQLEFNFAWTVPSNIGFGGTGFFNPSNTTSVYMEAGEEFTLNTKDYICFTPPNISNYKMTLMVFDEDENMGDRATFVFPTGKTIPPSVILPVTFTPTRVEYYISTLEGGRWVDGPTIEKELYLSNPGGNPDLKLWFFQ